MRIELTDQQRRAVQEQGGEPVEVLDPDTARRYVLIAREQYDRLRSLLQAEPAALRPVPPGVRQSQEALRRDLPRLLGRKRLWGQWAAYHGGECIGIARQKVILLRECLRRGLADDAYYVGRIDPGELVEVEDVEDPKPEHVAAGEDRPSDQDAPLP